MLKQEHQEMLRRLTIGDERALGRLMCGAYVDDGLLDDRTKALVCLAGLLAIGSDEPSSLSLFDACQAAGVERQEVFAVADAITTVIGEERGEKATASLRASVEGLGSKATRERP